MGVNHSKSRMLMVDWVNSEHSSAAVLEEAEEEEVVPACQLHTMWA